MSPSRPLLALAVLVALLDQWHVSTAEEVYRAMKARATPDSFVILVGVFFWLEVAVVLWSVAVVVNDWALGLSNK